MTTYCGRATRVPAKNKVKACAFCVLLCLANFVQLSDARKMVTSGRVTKPTPPRGYANPDIAKLSYSPSQSGMPPPPKTHMTAPAPMPVSGPIPVASAPVQQAAKPPQMGWNVPQNAPPPYSAHPHQGPPPPYSAQPNPNMNSRFNEPAPPYVQSNPNFPAPGYPSHQPGSYAPAAATGVLAGSAYRPHGHNISSGPPAGMGYMPMPNSGVQPPPPVGSFPGAPQPSGGYPGGYQPGGYPQPNYPQQPAYQPPVGGYQQPPGTVIVHQYPQAQSSGGSGLGTVLGAGVVGLAAGAGGAAIYDALKPKDDAKEAAPAAVTEATTTTTLAPINPNGDAPLAPLVPAPASPEAPLAPMPISSPTPNAETPLAPIQPIAETPTNTDTPLAPLPAETTSAEATTTTTTTVTNPPTTSTEDHLGLAPLAAFPVSDRSSSSSSVSTAASAETSPAAASSTVVVETPNAALNVQQNLVAVTTGVAPSEPTSAPQLSAAQSSGMIPTVQPSTTGFLLLLLSAFCRYVLSS
ncbi:uncharacterized protein LOC129747724 [Uranotaenia lowii]|uniref:uncharacterized protein LOC129747724 n=1 Tax=Uranotaenia lowii TaxID=190385 RepID=UPI002478593E|nr:uncharacterized protein LOC129747724 [Uranotaenia lowii]